MRRFLALLALLAFAGPLYGQDCGPSWLSGTGAASPYWIEVDGVERSSHTNLATALRALADSVRANPTADVRVLANFRGDWRGPCGAEAGVDTLPPVQDTLPPVQDTLPAYQDTLPPVQDTTFVDGCPDEWTCTPPTPPAPTMYVAGWADTIPGATESGLWVAWDAMPADSFRVTGGKQDGTDPFEAIVPGSDTTHIHPLHYDTVTAMRGCVSAYRFDIEGPESCDDFEWAPMVQGGPEPPGSPGTPTFSVTADGIEATWPEATGATAYTYWYTGHAESEGLTTPTNSVTLPDLLGGGFFCVRALNSGVPGDDYRCNSFTP